VVVSFSTLFQDQGPTIRNCIAALEGMDVCAVVTLGPVLEPADFPAPAHVLVVKSASHDQLVPQAAAMITHGGHGSVLRPLRHGFPCSACPWAATNPTTPPASKLAAPA
jgi:UDP:flavonoid glycosyltransferase YjiC (YdhE family)